MRTSDAIVCLVLAGLIGAAFLPGGATMAERKPPAALTLAPAVASALEKGLKHHRQGDYPAAIAALDRPAAEGSFVAQYTLAQIYSDNAGSETDHAKAYMLFQAIADEYSDVDPDDIRRAPYVAKALTALAGYLVVGIPQIGVEPDMERAADYLHHAALFFGNEDAQFELVKLKLKGDGPAADIASAKHWLSVLTQRGHAGAQAFLAELYWRGKIMERDAVRALALISVAVENAPARERIWIDDVYQNIFCGAGENIRKQATGIVAEWRTRYGRKPEVVARAGLMPLDADATRTCQNGEAVGPLSRPVTTQAASPGAPTGQVGSGQIGSGLGLAPSSPLPTPIPADAIPTPAAVQPPLPAQASALTGKPDGLREIGVTAR